MERIEYERLAAAEDRMWWTRALRRNLVAMLRPAKSPDAALLDAGCGAGGLLAELARRFPQGAIAGFDRDDLACQFARQRSGRAVAQASIDAVPFRDGAFDAVFSADVLCHRGVDERKSLAELRRCLKPGGAVVLNLPAYAWLYSSHDRAVDNARRYGRAEVMTLLEQAGFVRVRATYWNTLLFPLMVLRRKLLPEGGSEVGLMPAPVEWLLNAIAALEFGPISWGLRLPFGGSILVTGIRP